ncbi:MAG: hypothetical protein KDA84_12125 [Planctomycetaceae bacterium]|nr:hypothetical protein [Planctomycetaceae bacterium]
MSVALPQFRVGEPVRHEALAVFPLFSDSVGNVDYHLSDSALADGSLLVEEINESGSVPELLVENKGDVRVLFLEGEELVGAKQNRVLNTSVLVAAHTKMKIPVSCVEQGRWGYKSQHFNSSGSHSPYKIRHSLKSSVTRSIKEKRGHSSDQGEVWKQVASLNAMHNVESDTWAMSDTFEFHQDKIADYRKEIQYVEGASGVAVAVGDRILSVDLFDKPETCQKVWNRLLTGVVFDALEAGKTEKTIQIDDVKQLLSVAGEFPWEQCDAIGEGEEYRAESPKGDHASALTLEQTIIHGSVVTAL